MKKIQAIFMGCFALASSLFHNKAMAININVIKGWPCNVFLQQPGVTDANGNFADFNVKPNPSAPSMSYAFISGENVDYLTTISQTYNSFVSELPFLEPLSFNLKSELLGAKLGVDVCIPPVDLTRDDLVDWDVKVTALGALLSPAGGDWFAQSRPKISMAILASNCSDGSASPMSTTQPTVPNFCEVIETPLPGADILSVTSAPVDFGFKLMASRQAVLRFTIEEQNINRRRAVWDAGMVQIELTDPPLPPLLIGDLLGKQLFYIPDSDLIEWPGCTNFSDKSGIAFDAMDLQGPNTHLDLRWKGKDTDCNTSGTCADGNKRTNGFDFPVLVYLENGSLANSTTPTSEKVKTFVGQYDDQVASGENLFPSLGKIVFDITSDQVYRNSSKAFFSTTISRLVAPSTWRDCRVWFKRDNGFDCTSLPTSKLRNLCAAM